PLCERRAIRGGGSLVPQGGAGDGRRQRRQPAALQVRRARDAAGTLPRDAQRRPAEPRLGAGAAGPPRGSRSGGARRAEEEPVVLRALCRTVGAKPFQPGEHPLRAGALPRGGAARRGGGGGLRERRRRTRVPGAGERAPRARRRARRAAQAARAAAMLGELGDTLEKRLGDNDRGVAEARGYHAIALAANGERAAALAEFRRAVPVLIENARAEESPDAGATGRWLRLTNVLEAYIDLLSSEPEGAVEAFRIADIARG